MARSLSNLSDNLSDNVSMIMKNIKRKELDTKTLYVLFNTSALK